MKPLTFQTRITLWSALVIALGMVLCGGAITFIVHRNEVADLDRQLRAEGQRIFDEWHRHGGPAKYDLRKNPHEILEWLSASEPPRRTEVVSGRDEQLVYRSPNLSAGALRGQQPGCRNITLEGRDFRVAVLTQDGVTVRTAADLAPVNRLTRQIAVAFLVVLPVLLGFVVASGRWIARKALDPVQVITASAERVTAEHLERRVPVPAAKDHIQRLALVLNRTFEQLETSFEHAMRFSADASHELKTPLTILRTSLEVLLASPTLDEADHPTVAALLEQVDRLTAVTGGLLLLARADAGKLRLDLQRVDLCEVIAGCVDDARILGEGQSIEIALSLPERAVVLGDETRLRQILSNLLDNAVKYNVPGGLVDVSLARVGAAWALEVANTGAGIAPEHRTHIFKRFFRSEHFAHISGNGLGLSLASELARAHGGILELVKSDAEWTIFRLALPAAARAPVATGAVRVVARTG